MTPVIPYSISNVSLIPGTIFARKTNCSTRLSLSKKIAVNTSCSQSFLLTRSDSFRLLPPYGKGYSLRLVSATGTDVAVEEPNTPVVGEEGSVEAEAKPEAAPSPAQSKRQPGKKSEFPPLTNEELVVGATFTGKVVSIMPFGAFVDFGAFTDGLVHVSQLSDSFVKEIGSVVSVGQEVKVRLIEANVETGRISLSMRSGEDAGKGQQRKESPGAGASGGSERGGPGRKNASKQSGQRKGEPKKVSKFVKGQDLEGTVKNMNRAGAFVSLPEGEEGFLPISEEIDDGFGTMMGQTTLEIGQEVSVRVLRISKGQLTLTMKKEEDIPKTNTQVGQGVIHTATNPFLLAFRKNKGVAAFLDEREKVGKDVGKPVEPPVESEKDEVVVSETVSDAPEALDQLVTGDEVPSTTDEAPSESAGVDASALEEATTDVPESNEEPETTVPSTASSVGGDVQATEETEVSSEVLNAEESVATEDSVSEEASSMDAVVGSEEKSESPAEPSEQIVASESATADEVAEQQPEDKEVKDKLPVETPPAETEEPSSVTTESKTVPDSDINGSAASSSDPPPETAKATISPVLVKQLREETGAGMMDCKKALSETGGDIVKAQEYLRKKGLASAEKKASRATAEGRIGSYIHDSRIGVLVEVNCETDFVSRGDIFKELVEDLAMQVAACPQVQYLATEDVPEEIASKEREIEMQKEDLQSKPEQIRSKIVDGRIKKRLDELALLEQPYIKNDKVLVKDWVKQTIATIGENIKVKRFVRYNLGEGLEKKSQDFAAEVAAQTAAKPAAPKPQPDVAAAAAGEAKETVEKPPTVAVSAALVKQLREETGAGMMDCKKALSETGGDLEKAQEYLRKKGLASADKKSSRLAAEGRIGSYIHDARIGVLIEVNCETDFVGRSERFKELVDDLAMQVVACPQVSFVSVEDIPEETAKKEKELEMQREDIQSKPENIRERIVEGRVNKRLGELALLEQPFIKNDSILIKDLVKQTVAALGENIKVRRFVCFTLGETVENADS